MPSKVKIIHAETDPACTTRISIGGDEEMGYYCTYRGPLHLCSAAIRRVAYELSQIEPGKEPPVQHEIRRIGDTRN
jgi:hypothetical protein